MFRGMHMKSVMLGGALVFVALRSLAQTGGECEMTLENSMGPLDYRIASRDVIKMVETHHFSARVESLAGGQSGAIGPDLAYTLRVFPNHARALLALSKLARVQKTSRVAGAMYTVDCWFQRAISFQPEDSQVRLVYGIELLKDGKREAAVEQLSIAEKLAPNDANVQYNLGLAYFDLADFNKSLTYAQNAYRLGFPLPGLREKLQRAGKWRD